MLLYEGQDGKAIKAFLFIIKVNQTTSKVNFYGSKVKKNVREKQLLFEAYL